VDKLPRELRDLIYSYILEAYHEDCRAHDKKIQEDDFARRDANCDRESFLCHTIYKRHEIPYFALRNWVNETFRIELAETLYRTKLLRRVEASELSRVLGRDVYLKTTCKPGDHIRWIEVQIMVSSWFRHTRDQYINAIMPLYKLHDIKNPRGLRVDLVLPFAPGMEIKKLEEVRAPLVHRLLSEGVEVTWYRTVGRRGIYEKVKVPTRNFKCSLQELEDDIKANSEFKEVRQS
jgi:hypothetical protein